MRSPQDRTNEKLAWGPPHGPPAKQMNVKMVDGLAAVATRIHNCPIPIVKLL